MDRTYLQEAFRQMELLEEENFKLDDVGIKDILDFKDHDELNDIIDVVDPEAETEEEVKNSYIGDVILECTVCHSPIFKSVEDIFIDADSDVVNMEEECPICHSNDGFVVIGQVAPYKEEAELKVEVEDKPECEDGECEEDDFDEEELEEKFCEKCGKEVEEPCEKCKEEEKLEEELDPELEEKLDEIEDKIEEVAEQICPECEEAEEAEDDEEPFEDAEEEIEGELEEAIPEIEFDKLECQDKDCKKEVAEESWEDDDEDEDLFNNDLYSQVTKELYAISSGNKPKVEIDPAKGEHRYNYMQVVPCEAGIRVVAPKAEKLGYAKKVADYFNLPITDVKEFRPADALKTGKYYVDITLTESLNEGFEKVDLEMEDKIIHVSEEEKPEIPDAEMITPVSDELEAELMAPEVEEEPIAEPIEEMPLDIPAEDEFIEEPAELEDDEEPLEDEEEFDGQESLHEELEDTMIDYELDDFNEECFDKLGESYLKQVYENVESFKTSTVKLTEEDKLVVEGVIKFNSGKEKATQFIFEAQDATKEGKVRFIGENAQISRGKKSFTLTGTMNEGKFLAESLNYNYHADSNRIYGTVTVDKK